MTLRFLITVYALVFFFRFSATAERLDLQTHNLMIQKLEGALSDMRGQSGEGRILLRLADLYSDRARLMSLAGAAPKTEEISRADRLKAIGYYKSALKLVPPDDQAKSLLQMAHLYSLSGDENKSREVFENILRQTASYSQEVLRVVYMGLGEHHYLEGKFEKAEKYFNMAQKHGLKSQALYYRLSWCLINRGDVSNAKKYMMLILKSANKDETEISLKKDVARDLATILSRESVTEDKINEFLIYSDEGSKIENLFYLGEECDRLDNRSCSRLVWSKLLHAKDLSTDRALDIELRQAKNFLTAGDVDQALMHFQEFNKKITTSSCENADSCKELSARARNLVYSWIKKEKATPSPQLLSALNAYIKTAPTDYEMSLWAGHIARELNRVDQAIAHYKSTADTSAKGLPTSVAESNKNIILQRRTMINALLLEIECAESTQNHDKMKAAYEHYLKLNSQGRETEMVKSQHAALTRQEDVKFAIEKFANGKGSAADFEAALERLKLTPLLGSTQDEKIKIYRNQIQIAEALKDLATVEEAAIRILQVKPLTAEDREFALGRRLWVAEARLDFVRARDIARSMQMPNLSAEDRLLKIAILTELSGVSARLAYGQYLERAKNKFQANVVRGKIIRESKYPWAELKKHKSFLMKSPALLAEVIFEVYAKSPRQNELKPYLKYSFVRNSSYGPMFLRFQAIEQDKPFDYKLRSHKIFSRNEKVLQKHIRERMLLLKSANKMVSKAQKARDITLQIIALSRVARENQRFHDELLQLPIPRDLSKTEAANYKRGIKLWATEFATVAVNVNKKIDALFNNSHYLKSLFSVAKNDLGARKKVALYELQILAKSAPSGRVTAEIASLLKKSNESGSVRELSTARSRVRNDPFDRDRIEQLRALEMEHGSRTMVAYLEARIDEIKRGRL